MLCPLPARCTRVRAQSIVHVPFPENSVHKPRLEPLPVSWQALLILRERLLYQLSGYLIPQHLTLFDLQSLVSHLLLSVELCLESVSVACPECVATAASAPTSLAAV